MAHGQVACKGESISKAMAIIEYLKATLDLGIDKSFSGQLAGLYQYMEERLLQANIQNDESVLDEVQGLLRELSEGWSGIPEEYRS